MNIEDKKQLTRNIVNGWNYLPESGELDVSIMEQLDRASQVKS